MMTLSSRVYGLPDGYLDKVAASVHRSIHEISFEVIHSEAEKLARMVKEELNSQPPSWPELNPQYRKWKERMGLNTDMNKATESYYDAISVQEVRNDHGQFTGFRRITESSSFSIRVGVPYTKHPGLDPEKDEDEDGLKYTELAEILEYGTEHIPARPHWGPAYQRWKAQHARSIRARIVSLATRRFQKLFKQAILPPSKAKPLKRR